MNALELANKLEQGHWEGGTREQSALMLLQQQAEIESLKLGDIQWSHAFDLAKIEIEALKAKDLKKSMAIRSLNTQLKKALQYETFNR